MSNNGERRGLTGNDQGNNKQQWVKRGAWKAFEDKILIGHVKNHGERKWNKVHKKTNLKRSWKSCKLRWANHLKPNLEKGAFTLEVENLIVELHEKFGSQWAYKATQHAKKKRRLKSNVLPQPEDARKKITNIYKQIQLNQKRQNVFTVSHLMVTPKPINNQQSNPNSTNANCQFPFNNVHLHMLKQSSFVPSPISFHSHQNGIPSHWFEFLSSQETNLSSPNASNGSNLLYSNALDSSFSITNDDCLMGANSSYSHDNCYNAYNWFTQRNSGLLDVVVEECKNICSREKGNRSQTFIMDKQLTSTSDDAKVNSENFDNEDNMKLTAEGVFEDKTSAQQCNGGIGIDYGVLEDEELITLVMNFKTSSPGPLEG